MTNYNQKDWFTTIPTTIIAGESLKIKKNAKYLSFLANNTNNDKLRVQIDGQYGGELEAGLSIELPPSEDFNLIELVNEGATNLDVEIGLCNGKIVDARTVLAGSVTVTPNGGTMAVSDSGVYNRTNGIMTYLNDGVSGRKFNSDLDGTTHYQGSGGSHASSKTTIVSAGANTNGVRLKLINIVGGSGSAQEGYLYINGSVAIVGTAGATNFENILVPAGQAIEASTNGSYGYVSVFYEVL